ncbi:MAG: acetyl-CoA carboxylase biotin carboxyl carrier protein [Bdellovibrionales bacterium]|nr:acetyl-CoA carboxylase biotin carboxyl carrier protein [Bdellovibrionales bacterium]
MSKKPTNKSKTKTSSVPAKKSTLPFEVDALNQLADFLKDKGIAEFEWTKGDQRIVVKTVISAVQYAMPALPSVASAQTVVQMPSVQANATASPAAETKEPATHKKVLSPFVGTFYRSPSPTAPPYVEIGKRVSPGDSLCIIEAMKLMNAIEADFAGKIVQILVENGQPVEFGEPLFVIDTA